MRKILKVVFALLAVGILGYFIYSFFQKKAVLKGVVHTEAESVIKIGIHDIKKTLLLDILSSPKYYWKNAKIAKSKKEKDTIKDSGKGIDLQPYSMVFYTMKNHQNTYFSTLKIDDSEAFEIYILDYFKNINVPIETSEYKYAIDKKSKLVLAWTADKLAIAFHLEPSFDKCKAVFDDVLLKDKLMYDTNNSYLKRLISSENHLTYLKNDSEITINFLDGKAILSGVWVTKNPNQFKTEIRYIADPNASLLWYFDGNFENEENRKWASTVMESFSFFEKNNLNPTLLTAQMNGMMSVSVKGTTIQSDSIITYEYDDNFEKVATKSIQEKKAPIIVLNLESNTDLNQYLEQQGALANGILKALPYYSFYVQEDSINPIFSTIKQHRVIESKTGSYFFNLEIDFENLQKDLAIPKVDNITDILGYLRINARQEAENTVVLKGKLSGKIPDINIISQLFFQLQEQDSIH